MTYKYCTDTVTVLLLVLCVFAVKCCWVLCYICTNRQVLHVLPLPGLFLLTRVVQVFVLYRQVFSVASRLQDCRNAAKYIYWPHKWKASSPMDPSAENENGLHFSTTGAAFFFVHTITRHYLCDFL